MSLTPTTPVAPTAPSSASPATAGAIASTHSSGGATTSSTVSSLADLKKKAPEVYNMMLQGIAMHVCEDMQHHQERLKKMMRESRDHA